MVVVREGCGWFRELILRICDYGRLPWYFKKSEGFEWFLWKCDKKQNPWSLGCLRGWCEYNEGFEIFIIKLALFIMISRNFLRSIVIFSLSVERPLSSIKHLHYLRPISNPRLFFRGLVNFFDFANSLIIFYPSPFLYWITLSKKLVINKRSISLFTFSKSR